MTARPTARSLLARRFDPAELREIKRLWVRHSIAEDARDIDGLVATLTPNCAYELIPTGQRWEGHDGARAFYTELFAAFPDNRFELTDIVVGPQGVFEAARLTGTNLGPWAGVPASGLPIALEVLILFPWDPVTRLFLGERIWFDRGEIAAADPLAALEQRADLVREARLRLLVVGRREPGDQVPVADLEVRREAFGHLLRRPDRDVVPGPGAAVVLEDRAVDPPGLLLGVADHDRADPVVRSISDGSRPTASQCWRRIASLRRTASTPPPTLFASP